MNDYPRVEKFINQYGDINSTSYTNTEWHPTGQCVQVNPELLEDMLKEYDIIKKDNTNLRTKVEANISSKRIDMTPNGQTLDEFNVDVKKGFLEVGLMMTSIKDHEALKKEVGNHENRFIFFTAAVKELKEQVAELSKRPEFMDFSNNPVYIKMKEFVKDEEVKPGPGPQA